MDDIERDVSSIVENEAEAVIKFASDMQIGPHLLRAHQGFAKLSVKEYIFAHEFVDDMVARENEHHVGPNEFARRVGRKPGVDAYVRWFLGDEALLTPRILEAKSAS